MNNPHPHHRRLPFHAGLSAIAIAAVFGLSALTFPAGLAAQTPPRLEQPAHPARPAGVGGRVSGERSPLSSAGVYAFQLADLKLHKVLTDPQGNFLFQDLPAGLYKIIAHKAGFAPVVVLLTRTTAQAYQFLELQLSQDQPPATPGALAPAAGDDFWSIRASIPPDVLRDIEPASEIVTARFTEDGSHSSLSAGALSRFHTEMQAMKGVDSLTASGAGSGQMAGGRVRIEGRLGEYQVGLGGRFQQFEPAPSLTAGNAATVAGQTRAVSLDLDNGPRSRVNVSSLTNRLVTRNGANGANDGPAPVDFSHYRVSWSQAVGENSHSELAAQYTSENNFHRQGSNDPIEIPGSSRAWRVEGSYSTELGPRSSVQGGIRYRALQSGLTGTGGPGALGSVDVFGRGGVRLQPAVLLEYGLYSTLADGSVAVRPQGGVVLRLGDLWEVEGSATRQVYERHAAVAPQFFPTLYEEADLCDDGGLSCYELRLSRRQGQGQDSNTFSISALDRTFSKTLRRYFNEDVFDRLESVYFVPGDRLPELKLSMGRRLTPGITTKLEASLASGGGGTYASPQGRSYENRVQYLVTSLDTHFQATSTGVFLAFHRLNQVLDPLSPGGATVTPTDLARLQLMLSQDLNILMDLAGEWTVQLNMELSRGSSSLLASGHEDDLRKRFLGGIAVKF